MPLAFTLALPVVVTTIVLVAVLGLVVIDTVQHEIETAYDQQAQEAGDVQRRRGGQARGLGTKLSRCHSGARKARARNP